MKKSLAIVLSLLMVLTTFFAHPFSVSAYAGGKIGNLEWKFDGEELDITGEGAMPNFSTSTLPWKDYIDEIEWICVGEKVTSVGDNAFNGCVNANELELYDNLTSIGKAAFSGCDSIKRIDISNPDCVIADESATLPANATIYGFAGTNAEKYAKTYNRKFVDISSGPTVEDGEYSFDIKTGTLTLKGKVVDYSDSSVEYFYTNYLDLVKKIVVSEGITEITDWVFNDMPNVTSVELPETLTIIGEGAFADLPNLKSVVVPKSVTKIDEDAFGKYTDWEDWSTKNVEGFVLKTTCDNKSTIVKDYADANNLAFGIEHKYDSGKVTKAATPTATGIKTYTCAGCGVTKTEVIPKCAKYANTIKVTAKKPTLKYKKLKKKAQSISAKKAMTVKDAKGKLSYKFSSAKKGKKNFKKYFKVSSKSGKITVKKKLKKGTYTVKIKVTAAGDDTYKAGTKTVSIKVKVK